MSKILQHLGIAKISNNLVYGQKLIEHITKNKVHIVLLAQDAAYHNSKKITNKTKFYSVKLIVSFTKKELSKAIGLNNIAAIGIIDKNLSHKITQELKG